MPADTVDLSQPPDLDTRIWRYTNVENLANLLASSALYFARADRYDDPFEGSLVQPAHSDFLIGIDIPGKFEDGTLTTLSEVMSNMARSWRTKTYLNCWSLRPEESEAMWRLYGGYGKSVAIQSTYRRLVDCLPDSVHLGQVKYIDYTTDHFDQRSWLQPFFHKRTAFDHEREVRGVIVDHSNPGSTRPPNPPKGDEHIAVPVHLSLLVEGIYISPSAPAALQSRVEALLRCSGIFVPVRRSRLEDNPVF